MGFISCLNNLLPPLCPTTFLPYELTRVRLATARAAHPEGEEGRLGKRMLRGFFLHFLGVQCSGHPPPPLNEPVKLGLGGHRAGKGAQPLCNGAPCSQPQIIPTQCKGDAGKTEKKKKKYFCLFLLLPLLKADEAAGPFPAGSCPGTQPVTPHPRRGPPPPSPLQNSRISLPYPPALLFFFFSPVSTTFDSQSQRDPHPPAHHCVTST